MPYIVTKTNVPISDLQEERIRHLLGKAIEVVPGKSEKGLMLEFEEKKHMAFAGDNGACAMIQVVAYGNAPAIAYEQLTQKITQIISEELSIEPSRIYVAYSETDIWGWSGHNF